MEPEKPPAKADTHQELTRLAFAHDGVEDNKGKGQPQPSPPKEDFEVVMTQGMARIASLSSGTHGGVHARAVA